MRLYFIIFVFLLSFNLLFAKTDSIPGLGVVEPTEDESTKSGFYIPKDMEECMDELDEIFPDEIKDSLEILDFKDCYSRYGAIVQWMTVNWEMWDTSVVVKYFSDFGFNEPAEISNGIFQSYWNYINDKPIRLELKPDVYIINKNLFLSVTPDFSLPVTRPNPRGIIRPNEIDGSHEFVNMANKFTLIDSLYDPIVSMLKQNNFYPSDSLWYFWWAKITKFGESVDSFPNFLAQSEFIENYDMENSYNADFILILEDSDALKIRELIKNNNFDEEFQSYLKTKHHLGFYLIRMRKVHFFDDF